MYSQYSQEEHTYILTRPIKKHPQSAPKKNTPVTLQPEGQSQPFRHQIEARKLLLPPGWPFRVSTIYWRRYDSWCSTPLKFQKFDEKKLKFYKAVTFYIVIGFGWNLAFLIHSSPYQPKKILWQRGVSRFTVTVVVLLGLLSLKKTPRDF